jgi:hypothetical protein
VIAIPPARFDLAAGSEAQKTERRLWPKKITTTSKGCVRFKRHASTERNEDLLPAIWILSCNDENPIITYKGIAARIGTTEADAQRLIGAHRELFRPGILPSRLNRWKDRMRAGRNLPGWLLEIADQEERENAIEGLSAKDVFRNQFRVEDGAPKCSIEIINWGLSHLDLMAKRAATTREEKLKRIGTVILPMGAILVSLLVALSAQGLQWKTSNDQRALKFYEVNFKPKQENYAAFMSAFNEATVACSSGSSQNALIQVNRMESAYFALEPFLDEENRKAIFSKHVQFSTLCEAQARKPAVAGRDWKDVDKEASEKLVLEITSLKQFFRENILKSLFGRDVI